MDQETVRGRAGAGRVAAHGLVATALTLSLVPSLAYASPENEEEASSATNTEEASSQNEAATTSSSNYTPVTLSNAVATAAANYDLSKIADGTYTGTAVADSNDPLNKGDEWNAEKYDVSVSVDISGGKITKVEVANYDSLEGDDWERMDRAVNGYTDRKNKVDYEGVVSQINAAGNTDKIDAVTTATISSNAIKAAVDNALQAAYDDQNKQAPVTDEYTYGYAALTWAEYWANESVQNAGSATSSSEQDSHSEYDKGAFDVVTRATTNHGLHRGSYQCTAVIQAEDGTEFNLATWAADGKSFTTTDGKTVAWNKGEMTVDGNTYKMKDYEVTGIKYVPVKVKTTDLDAFKQTHAFVANGETLAGGYGEGKLAAYSGLVADVDATTHGLKTVTMNGTTASFSAADETGTGSGIKDQALKTATGIEPTVKAASGSYGEFLRVDLNGDYGDLGANMQSVTWTYYGDDSTYRNAKATYGTKFAADNWMHKSMGIQLGLTKSERCQLPADTDGTGYWKLTVHALGYEDYTYQFQATDENIVKDATPVTEETKQKLQDLYDKAAALEKDDYTEDSWKSSGIETETTETKDLLAKADLSEEEASEQLTHLQSAIDALVKDSIAAGDYLLMNIPYADLYAADTTNNNTKVDVFTSATKAKSKTGKLSGGSYGGISNDADDTAKTTQINGAQFPVRVTEAAAKKIKTSGYTQVTDSTSIDVTTTNRGQTSTTTYAGQKALYAEGDWAYYALGSEPSFYKELDVDADGNFVLSAVKGNAPETVKAGASFKTETSYGDYELDLDSTTVESKFDHETDFIYTVLVNAVDENGQTYSYGMRPLENVWLGSELAWCSTDLVPAVHNCPTSYKHYQSLMGKTIQSVTYYTEKGAYTFELNDAVKVPVKASKSEIDVEASAKADAETAEVKATLPKDFEASYTLDDADITVDNGTFSIKDLKPGKHTLVAHDESGKYADVTSEFTVSTDKIVAKFDEGTSMIVANNKDDDVKNFIKNITTVNVNGTDYAATGRGSVKIVNEDGSINLDAVAGGQQGGKPKAGGQQQGSKVFANYGTYDIKVTSTGYNKPLEFTLTHEADKTQLNAAIKTAKDLKNDNGEYSSASWDALQDAIKTAEDVSNNTAASDDDVANAVKSLDEAQKALQAGPRQNLKNAVSTATNASLNESDYTKASWATFSKTLSAAQTALNNQNASEDELQQAADNLSKAQAGLVKAPSSADRKALIDEIGTAGTLGKNNYTADSWKAYQDALDAAKAAANADDPSADDIKNATANLAAARQALVENGSDNGSGSDNGGAADNTGNDNGNASDGDNSSNANDADDSASGSDAPKTGDNLMGFAGAFAAIAAAAAGVVAAARRRLTGR